MEGTESVIGCELWGDAVKRGKKKKKKKILEQCAIVVSSDVSPRVHLAKHNKNRHVLYLSHTKRNTHVENQLAILNQMVSIPALVSIRASHCL